MNKFSNLKNLEKLERMAVRSEIDYDDIQKIRNKIYDKRIQNIERNNKKKFI